MSLFNKIFKTKKPKSPPPLPTAIQQLKHTEDVLAKKQDYLETKIQREIAIAKQNATKNKKMALQALKRKKRYERQLQQADGALTNLEGQREVLENANINNLAVTSMKSAGDALKTAQKGIDGTVINSIIDDLAEQKELVDEISEALSQPVDFGESFDEDELERELEELTGKVEHEVTLDDLPSVPVKPKQSQEAKELVPAS